MPFDGTTWAKHVRDVLQRARDMIADPKHWCKHKEQWSNGQMHKYCMLGAIRKVSGSAYPSLNLCAAQLAANVIYGRTGLLTCWEFNDDPTTTHAKVMAVMQEAIDSC